MHSRRSAAHRGGQKTRWRRWAVPGTRCGQSAARMCCEPGAQSANGCSVRSNVARRKLSHTPRMLQTPRQPFCALARLQQDEAVEELEDFGARLVDGGEDGAAAAGGQLPQQLAQAQGGDCAGRGEGRAAVVGQAAAGVPWRFPPAALPPQACFYFPNAPESSPDVGSSRNRSCGRVRSSTATHSRLRSPPLMPLRSGEPTNVCLHPRANIFAAPSIGCKAASGAAPAWCKAGAASSTRH